MTSSEAHRKITSAVSITLPAPEAALENDILGGSIKSRLDKTIAHWHKSFSTPPTGEFRTDESVRQQHFLASLPRDNWRVPYGIDSPQARELAREIEWRRRHGQRLDGLAWRPSDDPYAPANDPNHPYYLPKESAR